jgi:menaquinone-dependent protoporphyrinogen oxidase
MTVLIVFGSVEGQTKKVAKFVEKVSRCAGLSTRLVDAADERETVSFDGVTSVILAASVHERRHPARFEGFVLAHEKELDTRRTMFLSVSLSAAFPEGREDAQDYADEMKMRTEFDPDCELLVAGAVRTRSYDYYATQVLRHVVLRGRNFDPSVQEYEFTDWDELESAVAEFLKSD